MTWVEWAVLLLVVVPFGLWLLGVFIGVCKILIGSVVRGIGEKRRIRRMMEEDDA